MIIVLGSLHSWMRIVERSNTEVSGASGVTQFCGKLIFQEAVFLLKNRSWPILIEYQVLTSVITSTNARFLKKFYKL